MPLPLEKLTSLINLVVTLQQRGDGGLTQREIIERLNAPVAGVVIQEQHPVLSSTLAITPTTAMTESVVNLPNPNLVVFSKEQPPLIPVNKPEDHVHYQLFNVRYLTDNEPTIGMIIPDGMGGKYTLIKSEYGYQMPDPKMNNLELIEINGHFFIAPGQLVDLAHTANQAGYVIATVQMINGVGVISDTTLLKVEPTKEVRHKKDNRNTKIEDNSATDHGKEPPDAGHFVPEPSADFLPKFPKVGPTIAELAAREELNDARNLHRQPRIPTQNFV